MKSVLISIRPKGCEKILSGEKTIEVRKSVPKCEVPFKAYIYKTKKKKWLDICHVGEVNWIGVTADKTRILKGVEKYGGKVIGEFVCDKVDVLFDDNGNPEDYMTDILPKILQETALSYGEFQSYVANRAYGKSVYGWHISQLKIYDKPKELREFYKPCPTTEKGDCLSCDCLADNDYGGICTNNLTRPPQSWQYVEELEE